MANYKASTEFAELKRSILRKGKKQGLSRTLNKLHVVHLEWNVLTEIKKVMS